MYRISSPTFRRTLTSAAVFALSSILFFAFIYWQTAVYETDRMKMFLELQASALSVYSTEQSRSHPGDQAYNDTLRLTVSGLFESTGTYSQGNLREIPRDLSPDGKARVISGLELSDGNRAEAQMIVVAHRLPDQRILVIGRNVQELANLEESVGKALSLGVLPIFLLSIATGVISSQRMNRRLKAAQRRLNDIKQGELHRRLPLSAADDEFDHLGRAVNDMLAALEDAIYELHHVGNNIAHDLRTPLSRVRAQLERLQRLEMIRPEGQELLDLAIADLDQTVAITTAMLRLARIEAGRARTSFSEFDLSGILREVADLYEPLAESKGVNLHLNVGAVPLLRGDQDLIMEAIANLVDNAVKFTPTGGLIELTLVNSALGPIIEIRDSGPGIPRIHRLDVFKRFFRCSQSRNIPGTGLGLTLVAAIVKLHNFQIEVKDASPGCSFELRCF